MKLEWFITLQLHISTPLRPFPVRPASAATGKADNFNKAGRLDSGVWRAKQAGGEGGREGRRSLSGLSFNYSLTTQQQTAKPAELSSWADWEPFSQDNNKQKTREAGERWAADYMKSCCCSLVSYDALHRSVLLSRFSASPRCSHTVGIFFTYKI